MFRLIRLPIMLCAAFGAGYLYSEITWANRCDARGGQSQGGVCFGSAP